MSSKNVAWFSATVATVSALASIGSMFVAWRAVDAYPEQLMATERLSACVTFHQQVMDIVANSSRLTTPLDDEDGAELIRSIGEIQTDLSASITTLRMLGPASLTAEAENVASALDRVIRTAEDGDAISALTPGVGADLRRFSAACTSAIAGKSD